MIEYILNYMVSQGVYALTYKEQELLETGIVRYLLENGINEDDKGEYYKKYVKNHLKTISIMDLKAYFINYLLISDANQIAIEYHCDGDISAKRKRELYQVMEKLYLSGLGEKYVPIEEIKQILGKLS